MSEDARESPVWHDVVRVWTARDAFAHDLMREGRSRADWWLILLLYFLVFSFSYWIPDRLGDQELWDTLFNTTSEPKAGIKKLFDFAFACLLVAMVFALQWLMLPRLSGWLGGSRDRFDANSAYYTSFSVAFITAFISTVGTAAGLLIEKIASPWGSIFNVVMLALLFSMMLHWSTRLWEQILGLSGYWRSFFVNVVSLVVSFGVAISVFVGFFAIFPDLVDFLL